MCVTLVNPDMTSLQGLLAEFLVTSILVLVVCSVFDRRNAHNTDSVSIKFGLTVAAIAMNEVCITHGLFFTCLHEMVPLKEAIPVTGRGGLQGCQMLRILHCLDGSQMVVRLSVLRTAALYSAET
jgi:hypothetical protein